MRLDFSTFAFGYSLKSGGGTPNWATALGQGKDYKINDNLSVDEILKGMIYCSVPISKVETKIGKGGHFISGNEENSPIILAALFTKVYCNDILIPDGKFILLITKDTSVSHAGRLRLKYSPHNTFKSGNIIYSNKELFQTMKQTLGMSDDACFFVSEIDVRNQDEIILNTVIVDSQNSMKYENAVDLQSKWHTLANDRKI